MLRILHFLLVIVALQLTTAQIPGLGRCPKVNVAQPFEVSRYLGLWYEVKKYPFIFTLGGKCITADYGANQDGTVSVKNAQIRNGKEDTIVGTARIKQAGVGALGVSFPAAPFGGEANYNVLDTDYETFAVVYSCSSFFNLLNAKVVWILTRSRQPSQALLSRAYEVMRENGLSVNFLATTDNSGCPDELSNEIDNFRH